MKLLVEVQADSLDSPEAFWDVVQEVADTIGGLSGDNWRIGTIAVQTLKRVKAVPRGDQSPQVRRNL